MDESGDVREGEEGGASGERDGEGKGDADD
jgi:hypothetical protein